MHSFFGYLLLSKQNSAYGRDMSPKRKFSDLIRIVGSIPKLKRLRFVTSHPKYMSLGVVDAVAETQTACEGFHVPFQSGSNAILQAMGRGHQVARGVGQSYQGAHAHLIENRGH